MGADTADQHGRHAAGVVTEEPAPVGEAADADDVDAARACSGGC